jgi:hypothetical protein
MESDQKLASGLTIRQSPIDGLGCFATIRFPKGGHIAEYTGERISRREARRRVRRGGKIRICGIDEDRCIDGSVGGNGTEYINHSCEPNGCGVLVDGRIFLFALRDIAPGEEIAVDYVSSYHSNQKRCHCQTPTCRGTLNRIKERRVPPPFAREVADGHPHEKWLRPGRSPRGARRAPSASYRITIRVRCNNQVGRETAAR